MAHLTTSENICRGGSHPPNQSCKFSPALSIVLVGIKIRPGCSNVPYFILHIAKTFGFFPTSIKVDDFEKCKVESRKHEIITFYLFLSDVSKKI